MASRGPSALEKAQVNRHKPKIAQTSSPTSVHADLQQTLAHPETATSADILHLQGQAGNTAVTSWLSSGLVQREPTTDGQGMLNPGISTAIQQARGAGQPLPSPVQKRLEGSFKMDLNQVRLHTGDDADRLSRQLSARAFTTGQDIFFRRGAYAPETGRGERTLRHELTHVMQQQGSTSNGRLRLGKPDTAEEHQAEQAADQHSSMVPASASASSGAVQRELDTDGIATAFGGGVTASMVESWVKNVDSQHESTVQNLLLKGRSLHEGQKGMLKVYGVDVDKMETDLRSASKPTTQDQKDQQGSDPNAQSSSPQPEQNPGLDPQKVDIQGYISECAKKENMPSGALLDAIKDTVQGDLSKITPTDVDKIIQLFKARDFDALAKIGVSINHIVAFTGGFEKKGVGEMANSDRGVPGAIKDAFLGSNQRWNESKGAGVADFMQNSMLWSLLSLSGTGVSNLGALNMLRPDDHPLLGDNAVNGTELAGGITSNVASTIQATGYLVRSGVDWANVHHARGFNSNIRGNALRQQSSEATMNMLFGLSGLSSSGLGFGLTAQNFMEGGSKNNDDSPLGIAKNALEAGTSAVSMGSRATKSGIALYRGREINNIHYHPSRYLSEDGRKKEESVFPKLKAVLGDAQKKKARGQAVDIGKDFTQMSGGVMKSVGFGLGGGVGSALKLAGAITGAVGSLASPIINKIKGLYTDHKVDKAGYRSKDEYRLDRMRSLETTDDNGKTTSVNVRVHEVATEANDVYSDFYKWCRLPPTKQEAEVGHLSISQLMENTGEYMQLNTVFTSRDPAERREAIKNILLSRTATY